MPVAFPIGNGGRKGQRFLVNDGVSGSGTRLNSYVNRDALRVPRDTLLSTTARSYRCVEWNCRYHELIIFRINEGR